MPGNLARFLAQGFVEAAPRGWRGSTEQGLLSERTASRLGFRTRSDVTFALPEGNRLIIELEISRADPVTNQVEFLLAQRQGDVSGTDVLVSMFSSDVTRGRRNLSAWFHRHLRAQGSTAFQVALLPELSHQQIHELNHSSLEALARRELPIERELERVRSIVVPRGEVAHRIHFAGDVSDVMANLWVYNHEIRGVGGPSWVPRRAQYLVFDPITRWFAPSKFCAFVPAPRAAGARTPDTMTLELYASLGEQDPRFDGHRARKHLTGRLAFHECNPVEPIAGHLDRWWKELAGALVPRRPLRILVPPPWYDRGR